MVNSNWYLHQKKQLNNIILYVTLNKGTFGTEAPTHTSGTQLNGDVKLKYLADICEYETIMLTE